MGGAVARAHEIGTTRVSVVLKADGRYEIDIVTDAGALLEKLETSAGRPPGRDTQPARLQSALPALDEVFRRRLKVVFDGSEVHPSIHYDVPARTATATPVLATIHLAGEMPPGSHEFVWTYAWTFATYALTVSSDRSDHSVTQWLDGAQASAPYVLSRAAPPIDRLSSAWRYFTLGFTHILPNGLDHVLFVLGIFLLSGRARAVLWQVSAFTVAHSITLGLGMYDVVAVSPSFVEPLIALSIVYVAIENIVFSDLRPWRVGLVFMFGLLHGLGFAGALKELSLVRADFLIALLTFNAGVEVGQFAIIGAAFLLVGWHCRHRAWYRRRIVVPASALIASTALYWTIQRLSA